MDDTGIKDVVLEEIRDLAEKHGLKRVILFGSRARGDYSRASDIDLAVEGGDIVRFALAVDETTSTLLKYDFVTLSDTTDAKLLENIQREGKILYEKI